jgi:glycosyltransferase involved in cell wall biosynthesis
VKRILEQSKLSIIVITRNEARNVSRGIESALRAVPRSVSAEVLLVDSASQDDTVEIAKRYPINILRLDASWFLSAAAARHIGMLYSRGDWLLFLDGDMELVEGWLEKALDYLQEQPDVAGISGNLRDVYLHADVITGTRDHFQDPENSVSEVLEFGGAALYRRAALKKVGGFNPYIKSDEEPELCLRLRVAGYRLIRLSELMARHYCIPPKSFKGQIRRAHLNYFLGFGQISRAYWRTPLFWIYQKERGMYWPYLIVMLVTFCVILLSLLLKNWLIFGLWLILLLLALVAFLIKKGSLKAAFEALLYRGFITYGAVRGFFMPPLPPENYPTQVEIVQQAFNHGGVSKQSGKRL